MKKIGNAVAASFLSAMTAGCATFPEKAARQFAGAGPCTTGNLTELPLMGGFASLSYNDRCGDRMMASTFINSPDPKLQAVGATMAARISPEAMSAIQDVNAGRGQKPKNAASECQVVGIDPKTREVKMSCGLDQAAKKGPTPSM